MQDISRSALLALVRQQLRAGNGENLLQTIGDRIGLRRNGKAEWEQLRIMLLELAARHLVALEFESRDSPRIIAVGPVAAEDVSELERVKREAGQLRAQVIELQAELKRQEGDVEAAAELVAEAETARDTAQGLVKGLEEQLKAAHGQNDADARAIKEHKDAREAQRILLEGLREQIRDLKKALEEASTAAPAPAAVARKAEPFDLPPILVSGRKGLGTVSMRGGAGEVQDPGCGCIIARTQTNGCRHGGLNHDFVVISIPDGADEQASAEAVANVVANFLRK